MTTSEQLLADEERHDGARVPAPAGMSERPPVAGARLRQGSAEWETYRQSIKGLGASDAAAALGIDPHRSRFDLWEELTGRKPHQLATKRMKRGKRLEAVAREWLAEETGWTIVQVHRTVRDPRWPHLFCHLDGQVRGQRRVVEIKTRWDDFDEVPLNFQAQVQMQMALARADAATVAVMTFDDLYQHELPFEPQTALPMLDRLEAWYVRHVIGDEPPRDDSSGYMRFLGEQSPEGDARDATVDEVAIIEAIGAVRKAIESYERDEAELKSRLMESMAGTSQLLGSGFSLTWKRTKDREHIDWPSIAHDYRNLLETLLPATQLEQLDTLKSLHTSTSPGTRPLRLVLKGDPR